jgi:Putative prokaryotic signal transducing protein
MAQRLVVVYTAAGPGQADIIKSTLVAAGIPAVTSREGAGAAYGFTVGPMGMVDILVPEEHLAQAEDLLAAIQRGDLSDDSGAIEEGSEP